MKPLLRLFSTLFVVLGVSFSTFASPAPNSRIITNSSCFTENKGQWDERVLFKAKDGRGLTWWFERDGLTLAITVPDTTADPNPDPDDLVHSLQTIKSSSNYPRKGHALKLRFVQSPGQVVPDLISLASSDVSGIQRTQTAEEVIPEDRLAWNNNYFIGNDNSNWAHDCGNYSRLIYRNVWHGIDIIYYFQNNDLKYDYVIHPGADPSDVRLSWLGLEDGLKIEGDELLLATSVGVMREIIPEAYQRDDRGNRIPVEVEMRLQSESEFGIEVAGKWDNERDLVIDPLVYSTFLGGSAGEVGFTICVDQNNGLVVAGITTSEDFPTTPGAIDRELEGRIDIFAARLSPDGSQLVFGTYLGGNERDYAWGICRDDEGGFVLTGYTLSEDFPTTQGAHDREFNDGESESRDVFVARINEGGNQLIYSTYFGGSSGESAEDISSDGNGGVIFGGYTYSTDLPTNEDAFAPEHRQGNDRVDAFITCLNEGGSEILYCTYLGGTEQEHVYEVIPRVDGEVVVVGPTNSPDFPTTEGTLEYSGGYESFITRINGDGTDLVFSSYLSGGSEGDYIYAGCADVEGNIVVSGMTGCDDFPMTEGAFDVEYNGNYDVFVEKLSDDGRERLYATYLGGGSGEYAYGICADAANGVVVTGLTGSDDFPTTGGAYDEEYNGETDLFVTRLSQNGDELIYSTFVGGSDEEQPKDIVYLKNNYVAVTGYTRSDDFPVTENAYDQEFNEGGVDAFVIKVDVSRQDVVELQWVDIPPDTIEVFETDFVDFNMRGVGPEGRNLRIIFIPDGLPEDAGFTDHGDGTGIFEWQTDYDDAGIYSPVFRLTDGQRSVEVEVIIHVHNVNRPPRFLHITDSLTVDEEQLINFLITGSDPDGDRLAIIAESENLPDGWILDDHGDGSGFFTWRPGFDDAGEYQVVFYLTDFQIGVDTTTIITVNDASDIYDRETAIPDRYYLSDAFPNPFNSTARIWFGLPEAGEVSLSVWSLSGKKLATLVEGQFVAGHHEAIWDASDIPVGVYLVDLTAEAGKWTRKVVVLK